MNWVSQINFLHHFINNSSGRVVSTQPTVIPTIKNAKIISTNLGVPIEINGFNTLSHYLQYSTQDKKHLISGSQTFIKEVTDRTLFEEIIQSPFLKKIKVSLNKNFQMKIYMILLLLMKHICIILIWI